MLSSSFQTTLHSPHYLKLLIYCGLECVSLIKLFYLAGGGTLQTVKIIEMIKSNSAVTYFVLHLVSDPTLVDAYFPICIGSSKNISPF